MDGDDRDNELAPEFDLPFNLGDTAAWYSIELNGRGLEGFGSEDSIIGKVGFFLETEAAVQIKNFNYFQIETKYIADHLTVLHYSTQYFDL